MAAGLNFAFCPFCPVLWSAFYCSLLHNQWLIRVELFVGGHLPYDEQTPFQRVFAPVGTR